MQESNISIPSSTIDMSFLPSNKTVVPVASNLPNMRKAIVMPHLANRSMITKPDNERRGPFNTIVQLDNSSERSYDENSNEPGGDHTTISVGSAYPMR